MASSGMKKMLDLIILYIIILNKIIRSNIFFRPEEAMLETGESLSTESKLVLF